MWGVFGLSGWSGLVVRFERRAASGDLGSGMRSKAGEIKRICLVSLAAMGYPCQKFASGVCGRREREKDKDTRYDRIQHNMQCTIQDTHTQLSKV